MKKMEVDPERLKTLVNQASRKIAQAIALDLTGRIGFEGVWNHVDQSTRDEIRAEWRSIAQEELAIFGLDILKEILEPVQGAIADEIAGEEGVT